MVRLAWAEMLISVYQRLGNGVGAWNSPYEVSAELEL